MGKPNLTPPNLTAQQIKNFWLHINQSKEQGPDGTCWEWTKKRDKDGYGHFATSTRHYRVPRLVFYLTHNRWPNPYALHRCDNPPCCNPEHLFEGDDKTNMQDAKQKGRVPYGDAHYQKRNPDKILRGTQKGHRAKLTESAIRHIRIAHKNGVLQKSLASQYKVSKQTICLIVNNKTWTHC